MPTQPLRAPPPPAIAATMPAAFATGVLYDTDIWAQFDRPLDPRTVDSIGVHFELDTVREPVDIRYEAITRRVFLTPRITLQLQRTYTVAFTTHLRGTDGTPLPPGVFFQFTTNSLRRTTYGYPAEDSEEGPHGALGWSGNGPAQGGIAYDVYVGTDSTLVDTRQQPSLLRTPFPQALPATRWPLGAVVYWAVTAVNLTTGERLNGTLRRFRTVPADAPVDSVTISPVSWGGAAAANPSFQACTAGAVFSGPGHSAGFQWGYANVPAGARIADARMVIHTTAEDAAQVVTAQPQAFYPQNEWQSCACGVPGPPFYDSSGFLANAAPGPDSLAVLFASDRLAAFFEAQARGLPYGGMAFASQVLFEYFASGASGPAAYAVVTYYRGVP